MATCTKTEKWTKIMKHNQLGFNNFKSFGDRIQMFSDKPITLVYGANSIGKSSFLHSQLYREYLKRSRTIEFKRSDFAGDELALGGFDEFVHKKDASNKITFRNTIASPNDLDLILGNGFSKVKEFAQDGVINEALSLDADEFVRRLNNYKLKEEEWLFTDSLRDTFKQYMALLKSLRHMLGEEGFSDYVDNSEDLRRGFQGFFALFSLYNKEHHSKKISNEDIKTAMKSKTYLRERLESKDGEVFDRLDDILIFIIGYSESLLSAEVSGGLMSYLFSGKKSDPGKFFDCFKRALTHLKHVNEINSISFDLTHGQKSGASNVKSTDSVDITVKVNNSIIITGQLLEGKKIKAEVTDEGELFLKNLYKVRSFDDALKPDGYDVEFPYLGSDLIRQIMNVFEVQSVNEAGWSILNMFPRQGQAKQETVDVYMEVFVENLLKKIHQNYFNESNRTIQYFGPLRVYPNRTDLVVSQQGEIKWEDFLQEESVRDVFIKEYFKDLNLWAFKRSPKLAIYLRALSHIFTGRFWRLVFRDVSVMDSINFFNKTDNKIAYGKANSASKLWKFLVSSEALQQEMNHWLLDDSKLKSTYELKTEEITEKSWLRKIFFLKQKKYKSLKFVDKKTGTSVIPREMGLGISQFLPIFLASKVLKRSTQFIEQPELHLHPALQCEVADEFIRSMNTQNNRFFIETHSEHLLLRIMKRLRHSSEGKLKKGDDLYLTPDDVCLLYVDDNAEFTYLNELELDDDGSLLDPWPNGFFEEGLDEMFT